MEVGNEAWPKNTTRHQGRSVCVFLARDTIVEIDWISWKPWGMNQSPPLAEKKELCKGKVNQYSVGE